MILDLGTWRDNANNPDRLMSVAVHLPDDHLPQSVKIDVVKLLDRAAGRHDGRTKSHGIVVVIEMAGSVSQQGDDGSKVESEKGAK